jgi:hypothetical protein
MRPVEGWSGVDGTKTERLMALLLAQRKEAAIRAHLARDVPEWTESSARLANLNDQIMHTGAYGSSVSEMVGDGLELELDSRPVEDPSFHRHVVDMVRQALAVLNRGRRARGELNRGSAREMPFGETHDVITQAQALLRQRYPDAIIAAGPPLPQPGTIVLRADRDGRVA